MIFERGHFESKNINESILNDFLQEVKSFGQKKPHSNSRTVFLSHKQSDLNDLQGVIGLFKELDVKVYIDSMDNRVSKESSGETARRIKEIIKFCRKFVLLATDKAIESYWCNWELGVGDSHKIIEHIAILPMKEKNASDQEYKGNEYLQTYPRINYNKAFTNGNGHYFKAGYYVEIPSKDGTVIITELEKWLNG